MNLSDNAKDVRFYPMDPDKIISVEENGYIEVPLPLLFISLTPTPLSPHTASLHQEPWEGSIVLEQAQCKHGKVFSYLQRYAATQS